MRKVQLQVNNAYYHGYTKRILMTVSNEDNMDKFYQQRLWQSGVYIYIIEFKVHKMYFTIASARHEK